MSNPLHPRRRHLRSVVLLAGALLLLLLLRSALLHRALPLPSRRGPDLPAAKQAALKRVEALEGAARNVKGPSKPAHPTPPAARPDPEPAGGVLDGDLGPVPFPARLYRIQNRWLGKVDGKTLVVYAGVQTENLDQGVLIVFWPASGKRFEVYRTPPGGCPTITGLEGRTLSLTLPTGPVTFDLDTHAFVDP